MKDRGDKEVTLQREEGRHSSSYFPWGNFLNLIESLEFNWPQVGDKSRAINKKYMHVIYNLKINKGKIWIEAKHS